MEEMSDNYDVLGHFVSLDGTLISPLPPDASLSYSVCMWGCLGTVTCRSTQQQAQLKEASLSGEINPILVRVHCPALQAHLCVRGLAGASQVQTQDPCPLLGTAEGGHPRRAGANAAGAKAISRPCPTLPGARSSLCHASAQRQGFLPLISLFPVGDFLERCCRNKP